jgi:signal transduction histidine kinase/CheY-like chemotaxis protein
VPSPSTVEDKLRLLESCVRGIVIEFDGEGRYLEVWTHDESLLARPRNQLIGATLLEVFGPEGSQHFLEMVRDILKERQPKRIEYPLEVPSGSRWFSAEGFVGQRPGTTVVLVQDITERKRLEARVIESDRLAAIGLLAGGVGHEINNPLAWVMNELGAVSSELAGAKTVEAADISRWAARLGGALEGVVRVRDIVRDLAFFTRPPEAELTTIDLRRSLNWACDIAMAELRHRARLTKEYGPAPLVSAPEARLGQVFLNLIVNAAQAIPEGAAASHEVRVELSTDAGGNAVIDVVDTGAGITPENQPHLFEPFFTTKGQGAGTGLGLSVSRRIIDELGGALELMTTRPGHTRFRVKLPPAREVGAARRAEAAPPQLTRRLVVLVIDDHPGFLTSLPWALAPQVDVVPAASARSGLERLRRGENFDAILCDLMMPDLTGMDLYELLAKELPALLPRFVLMTGGATSPKARAFLESVPVPRIQKPFRPEELFALLARICDPAGENPGA